jgi:predicted aspartyl protease
MSIRNVLAGRSKKQKLQHHHPIAFGVMRASKGTSKSKAIRILLDSGATGSFIVERLTHKLRVRNGTPSVWKTGNGNVSTSKTVKTHFILPELYHDRIIEHKFNVLSTPIGYDMILGTDLMSELGLKLDFKEACVEWDEASMPFKSRDATLESVYSVIEDPADSMLDSMGRVKRILDAHYEKADLDKTVESMTHLSVDERAALLTLLRKHEPLFDGTLGHWRGKTYDIELKPDAKPYHACCYPIPKVYEETIKKEVE